MSRKEKLELLDAYIKSNVAPILIEGIPTEVFENSVVLKSNCDISELNGHYEDINFVAPIWYQEIKSKENENHNLLIIDEILDVSKTEQKKFYELFKYRKISTFKLPKNCVIIVTCKKLKKELMNEQIYSLVAHIGDTNEN